MHDSLVFFLFDWIWCVHLPPPQQAEVIRAWGGGFGETSQIVHQPSLCWVRYKFSCNVMIHSKNGKYLVQQLARAGMPETKPHTISRLWAWHACKKQLTEGAQKWKKWKAQFAVVVSVATAESHPLFRCLGLLGNLRCAPLPPMLPHSTPQIKHTQFQQIARWDPRQ